jgi:hypothetical protein
MDAEQAGEDRGGDLGGEGEQGGGPVAAGADADLLESLAELAGADGLAVPPAWNSQDVVPGVLMMVLARRVATRSRTRPASGSGSTTGAVPSWRETLSPLAWTWPAVRRLMVAKFWA